MGKISYRQLAAIVIGLVIVSGAYTSVYGTVSGAAVSGVAFIDLNGDGIQDEVEVGLADVFICVDNFAAEFSDCTFTDADGLFFFSGIPAGDIEVTQETPFGYILTTVDSYSVNVPDFETFGDAIFGYQPVDEAATVSGFKFIDTNGDGFWDEGEGVLEGVQINAISADYTYTTGGGESGPVYDFTDISTTGTEVLSDADEDYITVPLPFTFEYYGISYDELNIESNGLVSFVEPVNDFENVALADTSFRNFIAVFWDDLTGEDNDGTVYYETIGAEPDRQFVVQWDNVQHFESSDSGVTFQLILFEGTNEILFQYEDTDFGNIAPEESNFADDGISATIGLAGPVSGIDLEYSFDSDSISDGLPILFTPDETIVHGSDTTDAEGFYEISDLPLDTDIIVYEVVPDGYQPTTPVGGAESTFFDSEFTSQEIDFGNQPVATITGFKFIDTDEDGVFDGDEEVLEDVLICASYFDVIDEIEIGICDSTNELGSYLLSVPVGIELTVSEEVPLGYTPTTPEGGSTVVTLDAGDTFELDFGNAPAEGTVSGFKFDDENGNGIWDDEEGTIPDVEITASQTTYQTFTSPDGVTYDFHDISATGTPLDGEFGFVELPFTFNAYGIPNDFVSIGEDGAIFLGEVIISPFEADLTTANFGEVYYETMGEAPNRHFMVQWDDIEHAPFSQSGATFEVLLFEGTDEILFQYEDPDVGLIGDEGAEAFPFVGIEGPSGSGAVEFDPDSLEANMAILFVPTTEIIGSDITDEDGFYEIEIPGASTILVTETVPEGYEQTAPEGGYEVVFVEEEGEDIEVDFGNFLPGGLIIHIIKFIDSDEDAVFDDDEFGQWGVEFIISDADGNEIGSTFTNFDGIAVFSLDPEEHPDPYTVEEVVPDGSTPTTPSSQEVTDLGGAVTLEFGNAVESGIFGIKYNDLNGNGFYDGDDVPLEGWTIGLATEVDGEIATTATDENGEYSFTNLEEDEYEVYEYQQEGWAQTQPPYGESYFLFVGSGYVYERIDFGNFEIGEGSTTEISGTKYEDLNVNGFRDDGEPGIEGVDIFLIGIDASDFGIDPSTYNENIVDDVTTDLDGFYNFSGISPGYYIVREDLDALAGSGYGPVNPAGGFHIVFLEFGQQITDLDFGNAQTDSSLSGFKFEDLNGNGVYDGTDVPMVATIIVEKYDFETGQITIIDEFDTNLDGTWSLDVAPGTYMVREDVPDGYTQTLPLYRLYWVGVGPSQDVTGLDFGNAPGSVGSGSISGTKYEDLDGDGFWDQDDEPGLEGVTIFLFGQDFLETTTDADGEYSFEDLTPGIYYVFEQQPFGYKQTQPEAEFYGSGYYNILISPGQEETGVDFGNAPPSQGTISGIKFEDADADGIQDDGELGIEGFEICLYDYENGEECMETGPDGEYSFDRPTNQYYYVYETFEELQDSGLVPVSPIYGYYFVVLQDDGTYIEPWTGVQYESLDFANTEGEGSISGTKWNDEDGDAVFDDTEIGEGDVSIDVYRIDPATGSQLYLETVFTDENGEYEVTALPPSTYMLVMNPPFGTVQTFPENSEPQFVTLGFEDAVDEVDFGNQEIDPGTVEVVKFNDVDGDGLFDSGEGIINGTEVCAGNFFTYECQTTEDIVLTFENVFGFAAVWENSPAPDTVPTGSYIERDGEIDPDSVVTWAYQYFEVASGETVTVYIGNKELEPLPDDVTLPFASDYDGDGEPEQVRGQDLTVQKDLTSLLEQAGKTNADVVTVLGTVTLDDETTRSTEMTLQEGNVYSGMIGGPFTGNSLDLVIEVDFSPEGEDVGDAQEQGDIVLIDPEGTIYDRSTGDPIDGAEVTLQRDSGGGVFAAPDDSLIDPDTNPQTTAADGEYSWDVAAGDYQVAATADGYEPGVSRVVTVPPPQSGVDVYLTPDDGLDYDADLSDPSINLGGSVTVTVSTNDVIAQNGTAEFAWFAPGGVVAIETDTVAMGGDDEAVSPEFEPTSDGIWTVEVTFIGNLDGDEDNEDLETIPGIELEVADVATDEEGGSGGGGGGEGPRVVYITPSSVPTLPESYFAENPLDRVQVDDAGLLDSTGASITHGSVGQQISVASTFTNYQQASQTYAFIVLVVDENGFAVDINWQQGTVEAGQSVELTTLWTPQQESIFTVKMFIWDGISAMPTPLSQVTTANIDVT